MICSLCATAADQQAPKSAHCGDKKCTCGHKVKRYGKTTNLPPIIRHLADNEDPDEAPTVVPATVLAAYEQQAAAADAHATAVEATITRIEAEHEPDDTIRIPRTAADRCRAEFHETNRPSGHCDLPAGHTEPHRDRSNPGVLRWTDEVAMYPTDTPEG